MGGAWICNRPESLSGKIGVFSNQSKCSSALLPTEGELGRSTYCTASIFGDIFCGSAPMPPAVQ